MIASNNPKEGNQVLKSAIEDGRFEKEMTFRQRVWTLTSRIPKGRVATYGDLARCLKSGPRAVGGALHCNPFAPKVPCHRVVGSDGSLVGFAGGLEAKRRLLESEGIKLERYKVDLRKYRATERNLAVGG